MIALAMVVDSVGVYMARNVTIDPMWVSAEDFRHVPDPDKYSGNEINAFLRQGAWQGTSGAWFTATATVVPVP